MVSFNQIVPGLMLVGLLGGGGYCVYAVSEAIKEGDNNFNSKMQPWSPPNPPSPPPSPPPPSPPPSPPPAQPSPPPPSSHPNRQLQVGSVSVQQFVKLASIR